MDESFTQPTERRSMTTSSTDEIPVIDMSICDSGDLVASIGSACEEWGFFQVINHGVPAEKWEKLDREGRKFFGLPVEEKRKVGRSEAVPMGYYDSEHTRDVRDWKEVFDFNAVDPVLVPLSPDGKLRELRSQWPQLSSSPHFREACEDYCAEMVKLSYKLLELIAMSMGVPPKRLHGYFKDHSSFTRLNYYPPCPSPSLALGVGPHKDSCALTVLAQDEVSGLEVRRKSDGEWILVKPTPDAFIINVGDVIQVWSNARFESIEHRVKVNGEMARFSVPFFFGPSHDVEVKPLDELVDEDNPPKYKTYKFGNYYATRRINDFQKRDRENIEIHHFKL